MIDLSRASAHDDGVARRTILAGAAWSIPVIATATVAPAASASGTLALAFNQASYAGTACSTITGAYVTATNGGAPAAGVAVTVTLSGGYTFAGGATTATGVSDVQGRYSLSPISVPAGGGTATVTATAQTTTSLASMTATALDGGFGYYNASLQYNNAVGIPAGSTPANGSWFLAPDGSLIDAVDGSTKGTGVATVGPARGTTFGVTLSNGGFGYFNSSYQYANAVGIPAGSVPVAGSWFLAPDGSLIDAVDGSTKGTGVATVGAASGTTFGVTLTNGGFGYFNTSSQYVNAVGIPAGSTPVVGSWFLSSDGRILDASNGSTKATSVSTVGPTNGVAFGVTLSNGGFGYFNASLQYSNTVALPAGSTPVAGVWFLTPDGRILDGGTGSTKGTGVATVGPANGTAFGVTLQPAC